MRPMQTEFYQELAIVFVTSENISFRKAAMTWIVESWSYCRAA